MRTFSLIGLLFLAGGLHAEAISPADPWALLAQKDLEAIRVLLEQNHPGPVDPQNERYRKWFSEGFKVAMAEASNARSYADYTRALRRYTNGFRDGHTALRFGLSSVRLYWPGFIIARSNDGATRVAFAQETSGLSAGTELLSCDGADVDRLLRERMDPYFWNADIPHERWDNLPNLFLLAPGDANWRVKTCSFKGSGSEQRVDLHWVPVLAGTAAGYLTTIEAPAPALGLRKIHDIWFVSVPSFDYSGEASAPIAALISALHEHASELHAATVVFDVRGNRGGNSAWGQQIASAFWGEAAVNKITEASGTIVDWRVSNSNTAHLNHSVEQARSDGLTEAATYWEQARDAMVAAQRNGRQLVRVEDVTQPSGKAENPFTSTGRVFLLTDGRCASACLDFADIVLHLPGVTHVGQPTSADAIYIDNDEQPLPSGLASLSYSMKVFRNRMRGNNQWYEPTILWPGGAMSDDAVAVWIAGLAKRTAASPP